MGEFIDRDCKWCMLNHVCSFAKDKLATSNRDRISRRCDHYIGARSIQGDMVRDLIDYKMGVVREHPGGLEK